MRKGGGSEEGVRKEGVSGEGGREWWAVRGGGREGKLLGPRRRLHVVVVCADRPSWWSALSVSSLSFVVVVLHHFRVVVVGSYCRSSWWALNASSSFHCFMLVSSGIVTWPCPPL